MNLEELENLRAEIAETDEKILELVGKRLELAKKVGDFKVQHGMTIKAFDVEKKVLERYQKISESLGIDKQLSASLSKILIDHACKVQEKIKFTSAAEAYKSSASPGKALIIGGSGNMGVWFSNFLDSFGYQISVFDKYSSKHNYKNIDEKDLESEITSVDIVVIASPLSKTSESIDLVAKTKTKALVFDIASLKSPVLESLKAAASSLENLVSIHPMFGPDIDLLTGENILICDLGCKKATEAAKGLFSKTAANVTVTTPEHHDELMNEVLGLSHIINLLFGKASLSSNISDKLLSAAKSTTFKNQLSVSSKVASENSELYFEIQNLNPFTPELYSRIRTSLDQLTSLVLLGNKEDFQKEMHQMSLRLYKI